MKDTDRERIYIIINWGNHCDIKKLGEWSKELLESGDHRKASMVIRAAERMQSLSKNCRLD